MSKAMPQQEFQKEVLNSLARIENRTQRLEVAVMGDERAEIDGLAQRVKSAEKYIEKDRKLKWMGAGVISVTSFSAAKFWDDIISFFTRHH